MVRFLLYEACSGGFVTLEDDPGVKFSVLLVGTWDGGHRHLTRVFLALYARTRALYPGNRLCSPIRRNPVMTALLAIVTRAEFELST